MRQDEREVLERAIQRITEQAANADAIVDEAVAAGLGPAHGSRQDAPCRPLLSVKADVERELETIVLGCAVCGTMAHYVGGLGVRAGHWAHAEPAPHATPKVSRYPPG
jgi:hypothetical protein